MDKELSATAEKLGLDRVKRHIFLCADQSDAKCCNKEESLLVWDYLKKRLSELGLSNRGILRTRANCLRICMRGPIAVVYPEGVWYHSVNISTMERIITEHLINGQVVNEHVILVEDKTAV